MQWRSKSPHNSVEIMNLHNRILLVEDSDDSRQSLSKLLEFEGYQVIEASDGEIAIEMAIKERPDLILMDLSLPIVDGLSATRRIKAERTFSNVPIIALSGHDEIDFHARALAAGCSDYISKPIDFAALVSKLSSLLKNQ
jgi:two-component system cell cycle response regulator DivK